VTARDEFETAVARWARERLLSEGWVYFDEGDYQPLADELGIGSGQADLIIRGLEERGLIYQEDRHYKDALPLILGYELQVDRRAFHESNHARRELLLAAADALDKGKTSIEYTDGDSGNYTSRPWSEAAAAAQTLETLGLGDYRPTLGKHFHFSVNADGYELAHDGGSLATTLPSSAEEDPESPALVPMEVARPEPVDVTRASSGAIRAFISYSHRDQQFALALHRHLAELDIEAFIDEIDIEIGESLIRKISDAIIEGDFVIALISEHSVDSEWCKKELSLAVTDGINNKRVKVLPVVFGGIDPPAELSDTKQFRLPTEPDPGEVAKRLLKAMRRLTPALPEARARLDSQEHGG
jgi:TIR domain